MSAVKLALTARRLRAEIADADLLQSEPIAIIGLGCRFPGVASTPDKFWDLLESGGDAVREIPPERWDIDAYYDSDVGAPGRMNTRWAGLLDQVDQFDAEFFGIAPREAAAIDPQQRLLLEVAWEALNDAGHPPECLSDSPTGVFFAIYNSDYARLLFSDPLTVGAHTSSGTSHGIAAGRLSYLLNLNGPSMAVDTACSSSLVAVHLACQSLRAGECSLALAGGVSALITPEETVSLSKWGMLAPDGRCKTFDASANGFVRGEGCGVIALKRLADALADGDRVWAIVRGSAVNQDGRSTVLTAPNGLAQQAVVRHALRNARVGSDQISYIEAHGTGTALGDPIEVEALAAVLGQPRSDGSTCRVGSVKTNLGHLEAAAGVAGLIKVVLAMRHQTIPPHLHFKRLNPLISLDRTCLEIGRDARPWPSSSRPRFAGVSSFGFGGTNAHVILEEAPQLPARKESSPGVDSGPWVLPVSARDPKGLNQLVRAYSEFLTDGQEGQTPISDVCYTASLRRWHYPVRTAFLGHTLEELAERMRSYLDSPVLQKREARESGKLVFVFSGHGSHWIGMGNSLLEKEPVFAQAMHECDFAVRSAGGCSVLAELAAVGEHSRLEKTEIFQPVLFAIQSALAALWRSWGITPEAVIGHSVGEIAAAHVAGAIGLQDAAKIAVLRGQFMQAEAGNGAMAAVEISAGEATERIARQKLQITVAAINAPDSVTLSGHPDVLDQFLAELAANGTEVHRLKVNCAFHSPQIEPAAESLEDALSGLRSVDSPVRVYSTVDGCALPGSELNGTYWRRNVREPVQFAAATAAALQAGYSLFVELSPHPVLSRPLNRCLEASGRRGTVVGSLRRGQDERATLLGSLASLYQSGRAINWKGLYPGGKRCVSLPPYPWQRERHWVALSSGLRAQSGSQITPAGWPGRILRSALFDGVVAECEITGPGPRFIEEHRFCGVPIAPATAIIDWAFITAVHAFRNERGFANRPVRLYQGETLVLENCSFDQAIVLPEKEVRTLQLGFKPETPDGGSFQLFSRPVSHDSESSRWTQHAAGFVRLTSFPDAAGVPDVEPHTLSEAQAICTEIVDVKLHYEAMGNRGIGFGPLFRGIQALWKGERSGLARISLLADLDTESPVHAVHPAMLDACLQAIGPALPSEADEDGTRAYLPRAIERLRLSENIGAASWSFAQLRDKSQCSNGAVIADISIFDNTGEIVGSVTGVRFQRTERQAIAGVDQGLSKTSLYEIAWEEQALTESKLPELHTQDGYCLVFADHGGVAELFTKSAVRRGNNCLVVHAGKQFCPLEEDVFEIAPGDPANFHSLLQELRSRGSWPVRDIVYFWTLDQQAAQSALSLSNEQVLSLGGLLYLVQAMNRELANEPPRLCLVSNGAVPSDGRSSNNPTQAPVWGFGHAISLEHPEFRCTKVDLQGEPATLPTAIEQLCDELFTRNNDQEDQIILSNGKRFVARLRPLSKRSEVPLDTAKAGSGLALRATASGILDDLHWTPRLRRPPAKGEVEIEVKAAGLNFRDVLITLNMVPGNRERLGG